MLDGGGVRVSSAGVRATEQLPLPIFPDPRYAAADFRDAPSNAEARAWLNRPADWPNSRLALWGEAGRGKTHLLRIWSAQIGAAYCLGSSLSGLPDPPVRGIALDEADAVRDETALFHLFNAAFEAGQPLLLAARLPPARWTVRLPDLVSRLRATTAVEIGPIEDHLLRDLVSRLFVERNHHYELEAVHEWLMRRLPRSGAAVREAVALLDAASLGQRRRITVPLAVEVLGERLAQDEISGTSPPLSQDDPAVL